MATSFQRPKALKTPLLTRGICCSCANPENAVPAGPPGTLVLKADLPATVYVNGRKVGEAPVTTKAPSGKVQVRFDCVVEDVRVRGRTKTVNLAPGGVATVNNSCE